MLCFKLRKATQPLNISSKIISKIENFKKCLSTRLRKIGKAQKMHLFPLR